MSLRKIEQTIEAIETSDGEGVRIKRSLGTSQLKWHDPFLMLDEFYSEGAKSPGFPNHPHRGFSTLTYMLKGHMNHSDNQGNAGRVGAGGFQWMTAGRGIIHSEVPEPDDDGMRGLQLWVNLPSKLKMRAPFYINGEEGDVPEVKFDGGKARVLAGNFQEQTGPIHDDVTDLIYIDVSLEAGKSLELEIPETHNTFFYVLEGRVADITESQVAVLGEGSIAEFSAGREPPRFVLIARQPQKEPVARYGPFVMNTQDEIKKAIQDFNDGRF